MQKQITTLLFDFDGTLIDTNELITQSHLHTLNKYYPGRYKREDVLVFNGPPLIESFSTIDPERAAEMVETYRAFNLAHHDELIKEFPDVLETLKELKEKQFKLAIVSTKFRDTLLRGLNLIHLDSIFDVIVTLDDVKHAKPHPEPIEKALQLLGSEPGETLMVGDNSHDIESGKNAGTYTAGVAWSAKGRAYLEALQPDFILEKMTDLYSILGVRHP
ncbi:pyrophosphatase PpaX [Heyndrickxia ginsengihumi]|uniref:Pyrophosphatase PpaX n=1 Tax=Heyndrickxia ginsengihumi TaxID=363870 RepID=A0A6M0P425_9BACI|nr:pyrophosphatase PpaX [Heyndrickxia ginsengihumi]MBE6183927.1 pyrophosphatase PpaX [Bacillus sp. (in: firmicutes)]MCM3023341.1 pyrophosphatase PpaX [Heyndrickxia ginsengihumi]NEY19213.1 pyrophosphatase PpaX [Heyndrickxia ginsengihumi]